MRSPIKTFLCTLPMLMGGVFSCGTIPQHWYGWTWHYARQFGIDGNLLTAVIWVESNYCVDVVNPDTQAAGLGQLMPATARSLGVVDPLDPHQNLYGSAKYLRQLWDRYPWKNWPEVLAAYHAGPGNVGKYGGIPPFPKTQAYVHNVLGTYEYLRIHKFKPEVK